MDRGFIWAFRVDHEHTIRSHSWERQHELELVDLFLMLLVNAIPFVLSVYIIFATHVTC